MRYAGNQPMLSLEPYNLLAGLMFGTIGWGAWRFGRKLDRSYPKLIGVCLMVYPYFVHHKIMIWVVGVVLLVILWIKRHQ